MGAGMEAVAPAEAERTIVEGLLYLEREASQARLGSLASVIRAAVDVYKEDQGEEDPEA